MKALTEELRKAQASGDNAKLKAIEAKMQQLIYASPNSVPDELEVEGSLAELFSQLESANRAPRPNIVLIILKYGKMIDELSLVNR